MANKVWSPLSIYRKQKVRVTVGGTIGTETFTISIGNITAATYVGTSGTVAATATGIYDNWNLATTTHYQHPYKTALTITNNGDGTLDIEAVTAGIPFTLTLNTPGGSATLTQSTIVTNLSPNDVSIADNWYGGVAPTTNDVVLVPAGTPAMLWNLAALTATHTSIEIEDGASPVGLIAEKFQTGLNTWADVPEYRTRHLTMKASKHWIGRSKGGNLAAITRCKIDTGNVATSVYAQRAAAQTGAHPPVQILTNHSSTLIFNRGCAMDVGDDRLGDASVAASVFNDTPAAKTIIGRTVTYALGNFRVGSAHAFSNPTATLEMVQGGDVNLYASGTIPLIRGGGAPKTHGASVAYTVAE